jgi:serine/threonine protein kinase
MTSWNPRANDVFLKALEMRSEQERQPFLNDACAGDAALRADVEALLEASARAGRFLESPAPGLVATIDQHRPIEGPGTVVDGYKLLEQIGEGGFAFVYIAEQMEPVRRKVAFKVLKPGMDTRQVIARFEAERQALALMRHPNIAHLYDGGETPMGRPYFVMELVDDGVPITDFCDGSLLNLEDRLELFAHVCQAVEHAHGEGIVHRDIKPSNVLVTTHDGPPAVKVIDFGIAKAMEGQLTGKTVFTNFALVGTPLYMSPEQAGRGGLGVDKRSDIYSLGVLLYELLTGTTPFDKDRFSTAGYDEMRRIIREEEPPKPSARLRSLGQAATSVSQRRQSDPQRLSQLISGKLDCIVMKAIEKERNRRYQTASSFAADVDHYLQNESVQAFPPPTANPTLLDASENSVAAEGLQLFGFGERSTAFNALLRCQKTLKADKARVICFTIHTLEEVFIELLNLGVRNLEIFMGTREMARRLNSPRQVELFERSWATGISDLYRYIDKGWLTIRYYDCPPSFTGIALGESAYWINDYVWAPTLLWLNDNAPALYESHWESVNVMRRPVTDDYTINGVDMPSMLAARRYDGSEGKAFTALSRKFEFIWKTYEHDMGRPPESGQQKYKPFEEMELLQARLMEEERLKAWNSRATPSKDSVTR